MAITGKSEPAGEAADWRLQIDLAEKRASKWDERCDRIIKRYRDERGDMQGASPRRMNLLWSNVQTLMPALYGREPIPIAERRFLDKDVTGRVASQVLERALRYEMSFCGFHDTIQQVVLDYCLCGRGVAWARFVPIFGEASSIEPQGDDQLAEANGDPIEESDGPNENDADGSRLLGASIDIGFVNRKDFLHSKARSWKEVEWVSRRIYMGRDDLVKRFGKKKGNAIPLSMGPDGEDGAKSNMDRMPETMKKAVIHEIWFKPTRKVYFIAKGYDELCDERDDPLHLEDFWPCPRPLFATMTNDTLEPVPDYIEYQDQAQEIDNLTNRIDQLTKALKVAGVYDQSNKGLARILDEGDENKLIPVASWAAFAEKGGLQGAISFLPIKEVGDVVTGLTSVRNQMKQDLYEITGMADVIRGQSDPRETAEAVKTKGRFGSMRLQARQKDVARFCRDIISMMGEIVSEHFPDESLINVSGIMYDDGVGPEMPVAPKPPSASPMQPAIPAPPPAPPSLPPPPGMPAGASQQPLAPQPPTPQQQFQMEMVRYQQDLQAAQTEKMQAVMAAIGLLRQDKLRGFRIDIETDSTIADDASDEKSDRIAFLQAASSYLKEAMPAGQQYPQMVPLLCKMMMFGIRGFRTGRDLENSFDEFIDQAEKDAKKQIENPAPPPPNPEMIKAQTEAEKSKAEIQAQQVEAQSEQQNAQMRMQEKQLDFQVKKFQAEADQQRMAQQQAFDTAAHQQRMQELELKQQMMLADHDLKMKAMMADAAFKAQDPRPIA